MTILDRLQQFARTLRGRLLGASLLLIALVGVTVGALATSIVHAQMVSRVDDRLIAATSRGEGGFDSQRQGPLPTTIPSDNATDPTDPANPTTPTDSGDFGDPGDAIRVPGQASGTLAVLVLNGAVVSGATLSDSGETITLTSDQIVAIEQAMAAKTSTAQPANPVTVTVPELGDYRMASGQGPAGSTIYVGLPLAEVQATTMQMALTFGGLTVLALIAAAWVGSLLIRRALSPLSNVTESAQAVSALNLEQGDVDLKQAARVRGGDQHTEVGQLALAFNRMVDHVAAALQARQQSEQKVRQFVSDASHELRTPLATIRGYAELSRLATSKSKTAPPEEIMIGLERIESESVRMAALVDDLLLLARLDEGRELEQAPVDLTELTKSVVADAQVAGARHVWKLEVPSAPVMVTGDDARLRQVLINLCANARVHTADGTQVTVSLKAQSGKAVLTVRDAGTGIPAEIRSTLFERFTRADAARNRASGSTGLGLSIVQAIVHAHRGQVKVTSKTGTGSYTSFQVTLPLA